MASDSSAVEKLRRALVEEIDSGVHPAGARLGGERELASRHGVSRGTLRQALAALEEAGLVRRVPGRGGGTFVSHAKVERDLSAIQSVPGLLLSQGYDAGSKVVGTQLMLAPERVRTALGLGSADLVVAVTRIRLADGRPISIDHAYFPAERVPGLLDQALGGSLYELLEDEYGIVPADVEERVEVVPATDEEAALLGIAPDAPLLLVRRVVGVLGAALVVAVCALVGAVAAPAAPAPALEGRNRRRLRRSLVGRDLVLAGQAQELALELGLGLWLGAGFGGLAGLGTKRGVLLHGGTQAMRPLTRTMRPRSVGREGSSWLTALWCAHKVTRFSWFVGPPVDQAVRWWTWASSAGVLQPGHAHTGCSAAASMRCFHVAMRSVR